MFPTDQGKDNKTCTEASSGAGAQRVIWVRGTTTLLTDLRQDGKNGRDQQVSTHPSETESDEIELEEIGHPAQSSVPP